MNTSLVHVLDKDTVAGTWVLNQLREIGLNALWVSNLTDLLAAAEEIAPAVCLVAVRPPVAQALGLVKDLTQEPRFTDTAFLLMGPVQYKRSAFEAGADDYVTTPPDVIELRKRVRLYLDRADLELRVRSETRITQEIESLADSAETIDAAEMQASLTLLEHTAALTRERDLFETMLRHLDEAVAFVDGEGTVLFVNSAWERLDGRSADEIIGQGLDPWPPRVNDPGSTRALGRAIRDKDRWRGQVGCTLFNNRPLDVDLSLTPALMAAGDLWGFVLTLRDMVAYRGADQTSRFLSDASVEMRTPVTNIKMRQYLLRQAPPEQRDMHVQALEREIQRLYDLLDSMLELSRLDSGVIQMAFDMLDLNRLLTEIQVRYSPSAEDKGVTLAANTNLEVPPVRGDATQLTRAVGLLVENAIRYTPEAGHINLHLGREMWTGGGFATIQVADTGIGIEPEALPHVFDRFYRSDRVRDSGIRGVGLGLSIAYEIIKRHYGEITVESQVNRGSVFTIWLPLD